MNDWLKKDSIRSRIFRFDILASDGTRRWSSLAGRDVRRIKPGDALMVAADLGGYDVERGFDPASKQLVPVVQGQGLPDDEYEEGHEDDPASVKVRAVGLAEHLIHVRDAATVLCDRIGLGEPYRAAIIRAAAWHDVGKAHEQFQLRAFRYEDDPVRPLAKARKWRRQWDKEQGPPPRPYFRHELGSALAFLAQHDGKTGADLVAYLIAAHHGKVRMGLRSLPGEKAPDDPLRLFARGVWDGDELPEVRIREEISAATSLKLDLMRMGDGEDGRPSWAARTHALLKEHGPFALAFLETLVRLADWKASDEEQKGGAG